MNHLLRERAPISDKGWAEIEQEATRTLTNFLAGRKLIELSGPHGWEKSSVPTGRAEVVGSMQDGAVRARVRKVQPLIELRTPFTVSREELEAIDLGACDADLESVIDAAKAAALAEDTAVFHGFAEGGIVGLIDASPHEPVQITTDYEDYPKFVAHAMARLQDAGVEGPFAIALGPRCYRGVMEESEMGGYPVLEHLRLILGGQILRAPAVDGAVVVSLRGGDFEIVSGQDFSIGYLDHTTETVDLYIEETLTVQICSPEAAIHLTY